MTQQRRHPRPQRLNRAGKRPKKRRSRTPVIRILPIVIIVGLTVLGFRVTVVVQDMQSMMASVDIVQSTAVAQDQVDAGDDTSADAASSSATQADPEAADTTAMMEAMNGGSSPAGAETGDRTFTRSEVELLQRLSERREEIEGRARELDQREVMLRAAETRIDGKIAELRELEQALAELVAEVDEQEQQQVMQMVNIYGAMKPKDAARIFNDLDMPILLTIVESMRENKVAPILAEMDAMKATAVTEALSTRSKLPGMAGDPQG